MNTEVHEVISRRAQALRDIDKERDRQQHKGYDSVWDGTKSMTDFFFDIINYAHWAWQMTRMRDRPKARKRLIQTAALCVAVIEQIDRELEG